MGSGWDSGGVVVKAEVRGQMMDLACMDKSLLETSPCRAPRGLLIEELAPPYRQMKLPVSPLNHTARYLANRQSSPPTPNPTSSNRSSTLRNPPRASLPRKLFPALLSGPLSSSALKQRSTSAGLIRGANPSRRDVGAL